MSATYIHGVSILSGWADAKQNLAEMIFAAVTAALADARVSMGQVDSVVLAAHDLVDGRSLSSMVTAPAAGAYMRDEIRLSEDGLAALSLAAARIDAHESEYGVVAAWGRWSEGDFQRVSRTAFDPFLMEAMAFDHLSVPALRMGSWLSRHPATGIDAARVKRAACAAANRFRVMGAPTPPLAYPLHAADGPQPCDMVVAAIVGRAPSTIRVGGVGHGTDVHAIGDRDLVGMTALAQAAKAISVETRLIDLFELDGATLSEEAISLEAMGLAAPGNGFTAYADDPRVNPSGGGAAGWVYPANGLRRMAEACLRMRADQAIRTALVTGMSPSGGQIATAMMLEAA